MGDALRQTPSQRRWSRESHRVPLLSVDGAQMHLWSESHIHPGRHDPDGAVVRFLPAAGEIGSLFKKRASISSAEVGCQGEVGSAAAMAAAGLAEILGGTPQQVENARASSTRHGCDRMKAADKRGGDLPFAAPLR
jgi:hypothetical protein